MIPRESRGGSRRHPTPEPPPYSDPLGDQSGLSPGKPVDHSKSAPQDIHPDIHPAAQARSSSDLDLNSRERAILLALDQYRYLDRAQIEQLYFDGSRHAQIKLRELLLRQLVHRWDAQQLRSPTPEPSVYLLTARGAACLSRAMNVDPRPATARARHAQTRAFHVRHDIEANGFFARLAAASSSLPDEGVYHWVGETSCRRARGDGGSPSSDGWGRYLLPDRELFFDLEWDRGTEHEGRLRQKASTYIAYFRGRRDARRHHALFVAPTDRREGELRRVLAGALPRTAECCRFWTTTATFLQTEGPLARIWLEVGSTSPGLVAFREMPGADRSDRRAEDCIGKPGWWTRRPGGGEGV